MPILPRKVKGYIGGQSTLRQVYYNWMAVTVNLIRNRTRFVLAGPLLKNRTGRLRDSIFSRVSPGLNIKGDVGTSKPYGRIWELYGVHGPFGPKTPGIKALKMKVFGRNMGAKSTGGKRKLKDKISGIGRKKKGSSKIDTGTVIFRATSYNRKTFVAPKRFLAKSLRYHMTGRRGRQRIERLAVSVGFLTAFRLARRIESRNPNVTVTMNVK